MEVRFRLGRWHAVLALLALLIAGSGLGIVTAQQAPALPRSVFELTQVAEDVYAFRYNNHITMFIVTPEGVITADPLGMQNAQAPALLKAAIRSVTDQPVKYLVITHWGADHGMGGATFADTATIISHPITAQRIAQTNDPTTPVPSVLVSDTYMIDLGGKQIGVYFTGKNQGDDYLVVHYPARNVIFIVDFVRRNAMPFRDFPNGNIEEWVTSLDWIEANLPFETMIQGHPPVVTGKVALTETRQYLLDLMGAIRDSRNAGHADNSPEMVAAVRAALVSKYGAWANFESFLPLNIQGAVRTMTSKG